MLKQCPYFLLVFSYFCWCLFSICYTFANKLNYGLHFTHYVLIFLLTNFVFSSSYKNCTNGKNKTKKWYPIMVWVLHSVVWLLHLRGNSRILLRKLRISFSLYLWFELCFNLSPRINLFDFTKAKLRTVLKIQTISFL